MGTGIASAKRRFAMVHYVCDRRLMRRGPGHTLTLFEGKWAYCGAVHAEPHHWVPTGGISFLDLVGPTRSKAKA
jgi:hypothetical protein